MNLLAVAVADLVGFGMIVSMLISSRVLRSTKRDEFKVFNMIASMSAIACIVDFFVFFFDGRPGAAARMVEVIGNTFCFAINPIFSVAWCMFTEFKLYQSRARIRKRYKYVVIPGDIMVLFTIINMFYPIIFSIDENNVYHRLPLSYMFYVVEVGYMIYSLVQISIYEKRYGKVMFFPVYLMMSPIVIGSILQAFFYGVSLLWVSFALGITALYMAMQNEFSYLDTLTGLYNRAYLDYVLENYAKDHNSRLGGIMIDVDYFKQINDTYGHSVGDEALIDVARVIRFSKPDKALALRFAGDEFILLMKDSTDESMQKIISTIRNEVDLFNETEGRQYKLSLSLGYTLFEPGKDDTDSFFRHMDDNMYEEKIKKHSQRN